MSDFLAELKRRQMFRVAAAYAVLAWLLLQVVNNVAPALRLPEWMPTFVVVLLIIGFPVALLFCWIQQLAPADSAAAQAKANRLDWILAGGIAAVIAIFLYQELTPSPGLNTTPQQQASIAPAAPSPAQPGAISMAVLPFANLSADQEQEFFSDGMTDEITAALARVQSLRVVGRSSAFQFKGQNRDLRAIGQALNAKYLIDGSVRREGTRVRITAQLVEAENGVNIWTDTYDRELTSVFATQEEIAQAIAGALRVPLGLAQGESLVSYRTNDLESYQLYLRARALFRARDIVQAIEALQSVIARDPAFAPAKALLAQVNTVRGAYEAGVWVGPIAESRLKVQAWLNDAETAAREAIRLDARHAGGYGALANVQAFRKNWASAEDLFRQALALDPDDPDVLQLYGLMLASSGHLKRALSVREQLRALEPFVPAYNIFTAWVLQINGQNEASIQLLEATPAVGAVGYYRNVHLAKAYAAAGRYGEAADTLLAIPQDQTVVARRSIEDAARLLRSAPANAGAPGTLPILEGDLHFVYVHVGASSRAFEAPERYLDLGSGAVVIASLWYPSFAPLRKTERFKAYLRGNGLPDYWRERGWPDLCRPVGADDFVCD